MTLPPATLRCPAFLGAALRCLVSLPCPAVASSKPMNRPPKGTEEVVRRRRRARHCRNEISPRRECAGGTANRFLLNCAPVVVQCGGNEVFDALSMPSMYSMQSAIALAIDDETAPDLSTRWFRVYPLLYFFLPSPWSHSFIRGLAVQVDNLRFLAGRRASTMYD